MNPDILTAEQAAELLGVHPVTIRAQAKRGIVPGRKVGRDWRFSQSALLRWVACEPLPGNPSTASDEGIARPAQPVQPVATVRAPQLRFPSPSTAPGPSGRRSAADALARPPTAEARRRQTAAARDARRARAGSCASTDTEAL